ncbi:MAG: type III-A CRISPR-associated RAMP protein Csm4 [Anaerolineae bacterium]
MPERVFRLEPRGAFHVGAWGIGREEVLDYIPSDTLFSALLVMQYAVVTEEPPAFLQALTSPSPAQGAEPPLLMTSAFPYAGGVRFFPRPAGGPMADVEKDFREARWVSERIFDVLCQGHTPEGEMDSKKNLVQGKGVWLTVEERRQSAQALGARDLPGAPESDLRMWGVDVVPRVAVDRLTSASNLFHAGRLVFANGCGLWLAARGTEEALTWLEDCLKLLQDAGLGGLRSVGHGAFALRTWDEAPALPAPADGDAYFISLSRYAPRPDEFDKLLREPKSAYQLELIAGWCQDDAGHPWRRRRIRMVREGARLKWPGHVPGGVVDVRPSGVQGFERPVWRWGLAFPVAAAGGGA